METEEGIKGLATAYFENLFTSSAPGEREEAFRFITASVTQGMNANLMREPSEKEIKEALFAINPDKAPGPDGMTSLFYQ